MDYRLWLKRTYARLVWEPDLRPGMSTPCLVWPYEKESKRRTSFYPRTFAGLFPGRLAPDFLHAHASRRPAGGGHGLLG